MQTMLFTTVCLFFALAAAEEGFCSGDTCEAMHTPNDIVLMQTMQTMQSLRTGEAVAAAPAKEEAKEGAKSEAKGEAKEEAKEEAKGEAKEDAKTEEKEDAKSEGNQTAADDNTASNDAGNTSANASANASANESATGCATRKDPRATAWFTETAPEGTPCVFGADTRDEGAHCIFENGDYGTNGFCFTKADRSEWGSCNDKCPLYGQPAALGNKLDSLLSAVKQIKKVLKAGDSDDANANEGAAKDEKADEAKDDKAKAEKKKGKGKAKGKAKAKE